MSVLLVLATLPLLASCLHLGLLVVRQLSLLLLVKTKVASQSWLLAIKSSKTHAD
jgi:hypothetical protein